MKSFLQTTQKIRAFDVDAFNRLKVSTIFDYFQDVASIHATNLKIGYHDLINKGLFWVLSWAKFQFSNFPKFMDEIRIETWAKKQHKFYSMRDFLMYNSSNEIICRATTAWLLLELKSLRPKIMPQLFKHIEFLDDKIAIDDLPEKFTNLPKTKKLFLKEIKYSDIDLNKHANNAKYIELIQNCYNQKFYNMHQMKSLTISFLSESKYGNSVEIYLNNKVDEKPVHFIEAKNVNTNKTVFHAFVEWKIL